MYLMNVSPVPATQTEWRRCGPPGSYCLPACFNDSDSELTPRGTPISDKVQMIIESLRSTQSSLEMGDEIQGQECHTHVFKSPVGSSKNPSENPQTHFSSTNHHESSGSDSDDSVDRGIEEAILEYLKEKDGHKDKSEHGSTFLQTSKIPRKTSPFPDVSKHSSDSSTSLVSMRHFPTRVQAEAPTASTATGPLKKYIKNKGSKDENFDLNQSLVSSKSCSEPTSLFNKTPPFLLKEEEDSDDSSSDDGIEEAIQRYQLEKQEQLNRQESLSLHAFHHESDSTSDDGIEEAIRSYQLQQLQEKSQKPFLQKQIPSNRSLMHATSSENRKRHKLKKKKVGTENQTYSSDGKPRSSLPDFLKHKGQTVSAPPKVNTSAELMCAEAILDISKTVPPGPFHQGVGLGTQGPTDLQPSLPDSQTHEDSSSVDSEDGIEQEIRKFLEQKAQMHKQPSNTQEPKEVSVQKKPQKLSLTQRRRLKEKSLCVSNMSVTDDKETDHNSERIVQGSPTRPTVASHQSEQSGDKSSSLDSDEDLDTAIKDLLKTKKKSKKKIRDVKKKTRKCVRVEEPISGNVVPIKKFKLDHVSKCSALIHEDKDKDGLDNKTVSQLKPSEGGGDSQSLLSAQINNDSSSVDSDDSIEQEIQRFLAEKAKVSSADKLKDGHECRNGTILVQHGHVEPEEVKKETQLAEILSEPKSFLPASPSGPVKDPTPRRLLSDFSPSSPQSCMSSVQSCSPSLLEPADGAGAARNQQRRPNTGGDHVVPPQSERSGPSLSSISAQSQAESIKWRQSLGLPPFSNKRTPTRTKFHITSSENREAASETPSNQNTDFKVQALADAWFSSRASSASFSCSSETPVIAAARPPVLKFCSAARQNSHVTFPLSLRPRHNSQFSLAEDRASMVHVPKDKSVFVELESNRTNHVQVQSRTNHVQVQSRTNHVQVQSKTNHVQVQSKTNHVQVQSRDKIEGQESCRSDEEVQEGRKDEEFVDESDCESDSRTEPEQKQGFSSVSLSRSIDPGITFSPCIALTSEERRTLFSRSNLLRRWRRKANPPLLCVPEPNRTLQVVKRKLQFVSVKRKDKHI